MQKELPKDYFKILGLSFQDLQTNPKQVIRKAYRRLAKQYHPDLRREDKEAEERMKLVNEAYEILSDVQKLAAYLLRIKELGLRYGEPLKEEKPAELRAEEERYIDILGGKTFKLPNIGFGLSGFAAKDLMEALKRFYQGDAIEEINRWISEKSHAWKIGTYKEYAGVAQILINPYLFLESTRESVVVYDVVNWLTKETKERFIEPGTFVDIRHYTEYDDISNVQIGNVKREDWGKIIDAVGDLAGYQAGWKIRKVFQEKTRNILVRIEQDYRRETSFDEVTILKQSVREGNFPQIESPLPRN